MITAVFIFVAAFFEFLHDAAPPLAAMPAYAAPERMFHGFRLCISPEPPPRYASRFRRHFRFYTGAYAMADAISISAFRYDAFAIDADAADYFLHAAAIFSWRRCRDFSIDAIFAAPPPRRAVFTPLTMPPHSCYFGYCFAASPSIFRAVLRHAPLRATSDANIFLVISRATPRCRALLALLR
jgi:hypothetical protein